jgi:Fe-S cluster assembly ATPase SufC
MEQSFLNWLFTAFGATIGWVLKIIWDAIADLKMDMKALNKEVNEDFVRKEDYRVDIAEMKQMLNRIFDKLDNKVDK